MPPAGCPSPASTLVSVVLPAPFRPTRPIRWPGAIWKVAPSSSRRAPARSSTSRATIMDPVLPVVCDGAFPQVDSWLSYGAARSLLRALP